MNMNINKIYKSLKKIASDWCKNQPDASFGGCEFNYIYFSNDLGILLIEIYSCTQPFKVVYKVKGYEIIIKGHTENYVCPWDFNEVNEIIFSKPHLI